MTPEAFGELLRDDAAGLRSVIAVCRADPAATDLETLLERAHASGGLEAVLRMVREGQLDRARLAAKDVKSAAACLASPQRGRDARVVLRIFNPRTLECLFDALLRIAAHPDANIDDLGSLAIVLHLHAERPSETERLYRRVLLASPDNGDMLGNLALLLSDLERSREARIFYERAITVDPDHPANLGNFAVLLEREGEISRAIELYEHALVVDPCDTINLLNLAVIRHRAGEFDAAELLYETALALDPDDADNLCNYAYFLETARQAFDAAELHYEEALANDPHHEQTIVNLAHFYEVVRGDHERAAALLERLR